MHPVAPTPITAASVAPGRELSGRLGWADAAKGVCIALVVLHHLVTKHYDLAAPAGPAVAAWSAFTDGLRPIRMPLFFVISGMFAASAVRRPWAAVARNRLALPYYVYVVWLLVHAAVFSYATALPMNRTRDLTELGQDLVLASTQLWYLYALAAYFVLAKVLLRLDARIVLGAAAVLSAATSALPIEAANRESVLQHFVFFLVGVLAPAVPRRVAELRGAHVTGSLAAGTGVAAVTAASLGLGQSTTTLLVSVFGVPLAIRLVAAASSSPPVATAATALGRRTLPVYVMHVPVLALLHLASPDLTDLVPPGPTLVTTALVAVYPLMATGLVIAACLLMHAVLVRCGLGVLFNLPGSTSASSRPAARSGGRRTTGSA